jgi:hypothetical protein
MEASVSAFSTDEMVTLRRLLAKLRAHLDGLASVED